MQIQKYVGPDIQFFVNVPVNLIFYYPSVILWVLKRTVSLIQ